jgi:hypothetical protein
VRVWDVEKHRCINTYYDHCGCELLASPPSVPCCAVGTRTNLKKSYARAASVKNNGCDTEAP